MWRGHLLFFFFFFFFFFFAFHFSKPLKFVLGLPKWKFSTRKKYFTVGKNQEKITLPPLQNFPPNAPTNILSFGLSCDAIPLLVLSSFALKGMKKNILLKGILTDVK